jgi:hypothetical protein
MENDDNLHTFHVLSTICFVDFLELLLTDEVDVGMFHFHSIIQRFQHHYQRFDVELISIHVLNELTLLKEYKIELKIELKGLLFGLLY